MKGYLYKKILQQKLREFSLVLRNWAMGEDVLLDLSR